MYIIVMSIVNPERFEGHGLKSANHLMVNAEASPLR